MPNGTPYCTGYKTLFGTTIDQNSISSPVQTVSGGNDWLNCNSGEIMTVSLGCIHSGAIKTDGTLWLWGFGSPGVLGDNSTTAKSSPVQTVSQGTNWKQVPMVASVALSTQKTAKKMLLAVAGADDFMLEIS